MVARDRRRVERRGCAHDAGGVDAAVPARTRSGVVLRTDGTLCGTTGRRLSDRRGGDAVKPIDPYLLVRAASLYLTIATLLVILAWRRPAPRTVAGALLACCWNLPVILALNVIAPRLDWW